MKYFIIIILVILVLPKCGNMNNNPIYKHSPSDIFNSPQLVIAQIIRSNNISKLDGTIQNNPSLNLDTAGAYGMTLLSWACAHRNPKAVEILLQQGANPNVIIINGAKKMHLVAMTAGGIVDESFELLLRYNGNPDGEIDGTPAVFKTVYARRFDRLKLLLEKGANIDAIDKQTDLSLMHFCAKLNLYEQVAFLIEEGGDFNRESKVGGSVPYQVQKRKGQLNEETEVWRAKVENMLIERGVKFPIPYPWEVKNMEPK